MSNDDVYASGLLNRALDPESQPEAIQKFLKAEIDLHRDPLLCCRGRDQDPASGAVRFGSLSHQHLGNHERQGGRAPVDAPIGSSSPYQVPVGLFSSVSTGSPGVVSSAGAHRDAETAEYLEAEGGFRSEHFAEGRLRELVGDCSLRPLTSIAYAVRF